MSLFPNDFNARAWLAATAAAVALTACGGGGGDDVAGSLQTNNVPGAPLPGTAPGAQQPPGTALLNAFSATLTGAQEVPANQSFAAGSGTAVVNPATRDMLATVTTAGIVGTAAHIHEAAPGISGPIIFPLAETTPGSGVWTGRARLTDLQFNTLVAGGYYFNVHSAGFPNGEIRGQITAQSVTDSGTPSGGAGVIIGGDGSAAPPAANFFGALTGAQEVPPTGSAAHGAGTLLATAATREVAAAVITAGIPGTAAHVHQAAPGVNGPIIVPLAESTPGSGIWTGRGTLTPDQFTALQSGDMYFNVHSAVFPNGEIRGQIAVQRNADSSGAGDAGGGTNDGSMPPAAPVAPIVPADDNPSPDDYFAANN